MPPKYCTQYVSKSGRPSSGHRTGKDQSSSQFPGRIVLKNFLTIRPLHSSPMLVRSCLKSCMPGFSITWTKNIQTSKLNLEKAGEPEQKGIPEKTFITGSLIMLNPLTMWIITNCGKLLKMGIPDHLICLLRNLYAGQEARVRTLFRTTDWFRIDKRVWQDCLLSPCFFNIFTQYIMRNARMDKMSYRMELR